MPKWGIFRWGGSKPEAKEKVPAQPPTEEQLKANAELDQALEAAASAEDAKKVRHEAVLSEQAEFKDPEIGWELIERIFKDRENLTDTERMDANQFQGKKGWIFFGATKEAERTGFPNIRRDRINVAAQQIDEAMRDAGESLRVRESRKRNSDRATVVEHVMADMSHYIFGDKAEVVLTDQADDRMGGCDVAVIFKNDKGEVDQVLGLDFTSAHEQEFVDKKIARSLRGVVRGYLNTLNYLRTKDSKGRDVFFSSRFVPRASIGVSNMSALLFAKRWRERGKAGAEEIVGGDRRASMLYALLEQYRGQRMLSEKMDQEKQLNQPSDATSELKRAEARILSIIRAAGLEWPYHQHKDETLERIRRTAKSTGKGGKMPALLERARQDVVDIAKRRTLENGSN